MGDGGVVGVGKSSIKDYIMWRGKWRRDGRGLMRSVVIGILVVVGFVMIRLGMVGFLMDGFYKKRFKTMGFRDVWLRMVGLRMVGVRMVMFI